MLGRVVRGGLTVAAVAAAAVLVGSGGTAAAQVDEPLCPGGSFDFNRDANPDQAAGQPGANGGAGAVEVNFTVDDFFESRPVRPAGLRAGDAFGAAVGEVAPSGLDGQASRCSWLVVGAPGRDVAGHEDAGAIFLFSFDEAKPTLVRELVQGSDGVPGSPTTGARFGAALAAPYHTGDTPSGTPLYVGAPGATVAGAKGAGQVVRLQIAGAGGAVTAAHTIGEGDGLPGHAEAGDAFGTALATVPTGVIAGAPGENDGAGAVAYRPDGAAGTGTLLTQNSAGVPGASEDGDRFGQAVAYVRPAKSGTQSRSAHVLVGAPGEAIGSLRGAGSVVAFAGTTLGTAGVHGYSEDTPGIAGVAEAGDAFGASVGSLGRVDLIAGAPGEDIGSIRDAGSVTSLSRNRGWSQGKGAGDKAEAGDRFGATLGTYSVYRGSSDPGYESGPLIGAPGENDGAGLVQYDYVGTGSYIGSETWTPKATAAGNGFGAAVGAVD